MNDYTPRWFEVFLDTVPPHITEIEVAAVKARRPFPDFTRILVPRRNGEGRL